MSYREQPYVPAHVDPQRALDVARALDLPASVAEDLLGAAGIPVYVLADDSYSMETEASTPHGGRQSRWPELLSTLSKLRIVLAYPHPDGAFRLMMLNSRPLQITPIATSQKRLKAPQF